MRMLTPFATTAVFLAVLSPAAAQRNANAQRGGETDNQMIDRFDAQTAVLKARLRLTPDEEANWDKFQAALHDVAVARVKARADAERAASAAYNRDAAGSNNAANAPGASPPAATNGDQPVDANGNPVAPGNPNANANAAGARDDGAIAAMHARADEYADMSTNLNKIADALRPLYASLDNRQRGETIDFVRQDMTQLYRGGDRASGRRDR
jgi:TolA-binding protein